MQLIGKLTTPGSLKGNLTEIAALRGRLNDPSYVGELQSEIEQVNERIDNLKVEDLVDGDDYATKEYVELYGGKIDSISVNGVPQTIDENKNVDLNIPVYTAGNGITITNYEVAVDRLILDCGTSTTML